MNGLLITSGIVDLDLAYNGGNEIAQHPGVPIVVKQQAGLGSPYGYSPENITENASLIASGLLQRTEIGPGTVYIKGSGVDASHIMLQAGNGIGASAISSSGTFILSSNGDLILNQNGGTGIVLIENKGNGNGLGGQLILSAFNGSGQFEYRLGGNAGEGWYARNSDNFLDLIPTSGQTNQMIINVLKRFHLI